MGVVGALGGVILLVFYNCLDDLRCFFAGLVGGHGSSVGGGALVGVILLVSIVSGMNLIFSDKTHSRHKTDT